ncbi:NADP-dependent glyceraldehyde-3-phosphate dehydrogenase, partial [bacterium]|nr:NADP-dependent glyceraldehyde-3-phosphate dehydrogenase [bacterium]
MKNTFKEIPNEYKITSLVHQNTYLVDGELKAWKGATAEVYSTISSTEEYTPTLLGTVPDLTGEEGL